MAEDMNITNGWAAGNALAIGNLTATVHNRTNSPLYIESPNSRGLKVHSDNFEVTSDDFTVKVDPTTSMKVIGDITSPIPVTIKGNTVTIDTSDMKLNLDNLQEVKNISSIDNNSVTLKPATDKDPLTGDVRTFGSINKIKEVDDITLLKRINEIASLNSVGPVSSIGSVNSNKVTLQSNPNTEIGSINKIDQITKPVFTKQIVSKELYITELAKLLYSYQNFGDIDTGPLNRHHFNEATIAQNCIRRARIFWDNLPKSFQDAITSGGYSTR